MASTVSLASISSSPLSTAQAYEAQSAGQSYPRVTVCHNTTINGKVAVQNLPGPRTRDGGPDSLAPEPGDAALVVGGLMPGRGRWKFPRKM
jgi:hypothetical protein